MAHDYAKDVVHPLYREAEDRVYQWLLDKGKHVQDDREQRTFHDFTIGNAWTLDVKCDTLAHRTGRIAWEQVLSYHAPGRLPHASWGMHPGLTYLVYVLPPAEEQRAGKWPLLVIHAARLREAILANKDTPPVRAFISRGTDRDGSGYAVDIAWLRRLGSVILEEGEC